jgi:acyl-CoA reductase-like NAD-dependent aldehyde dehydrogenase
VFKSLDIKTALEEEHAVAAGVNDVARRRALGNILIVGETSAPITQSIVPLSLAIAEGNTAVLVLPRATSATSANLLQIVSSAVDHDAILTLSPKGDEEARSLLAILSKHRFHAVVSQSPLTRVMVESLQFRVKSPDLRMVELIPKQSIAIVSRNADVKLAALSIAQAKFSFFSGSLAVALGLVLIDEFVLEKFLEILQSSVENVIASRNSALKFQSRPISKMTAEAIKSFSNEASGMGKIIQIRSDGSNETLIVGSPNSRYVLSRSPKL